VGGPGAYSFLLGSRKLALKALVLEVHSRGVTVRDIARAVGASCPRVVSRWIYDPEAFPSNGRNFPELERRLLALLDEYGRNEGRILAALLTARRALGAPALARRLNLHPRRVRIHLENLIRRGLVRSDLFKTFRLTPEGVAEARWELAREGGRCTRS
jgi:DNA-binding transcriptional ArsR family regulator